MVEKIVRLQFILLAYIALTIAAHAGTLAEPRAQGAGKVERPQVEIRKVAWSAGRGLSFRRNACWYEEIHPKLKNQLGLWAVVRYRPGPSCLETERGDWSLMLMYFSIGHINYLADTPMTPVQNFFEPRDDDFRKEVVINNVPLVVYQRQLPSRNAYYWIANIPGADKRHSLSPVFEGHYSKAFTKKDDKREVPKVFLDFLASIRLKSEKEYQARAIRGKIKDLVEDERE